MPPPDHFKKRPPASFHPETARFQSENSMIVIQYFRMTISERKPINHMNAGYFKT